MGEQARRRVLSVPEEPLEGLDARLQARSDLAVETARSAAEALERLRASTFDALVAGYRLPDADGLALLRRVRERHPELPVVVVTAAGSEAVASEAIAAGVDDYVPVAPDAAAIGRDEQFAATERDEHLREVARRVEAVLEERGGAGDAGVGAGDEAFVRLVAHDLRNPLAVARGWLDVLHEEGDETAYRKASDALDRMDEIVDDVETLARTEGSAADRERVELSAVATAAWEVVDPDVGELRAEYGIEVEADASMLQEALENLLDNAVEHGSPSGEGVTVRVGALDDGEGFYVADDGPGVPPEERDRVFESGYAGDGGSGLGLAIVERIADAHGWELALVESREGGARFEFRGVELGSEPDA